MEEMLMAEVGVIGVNILLLLGILGIYITNYFKVKGEFALGLMIFAGLFLLLNLVQLYFILTHMEFYAQPVSMHGAILNILQLIGFAVLFYLARK